MPPACPPRSNRQSQQENARTSREEESEGRQGERERGRKSEDLRPLACQIAAQVIKASNPRPKPARQEPAPQASRNPARHRDQLQPCLCVCRFNSAFGEFAEPRPVFARQQTNNGTPPACLNATGTGGAFTFSRPPRFSRNGLVPPLYHVHPISHFSLGNNLDDSPTVNELNPYLQNHIFGLTTPVFLSTFYNSPRLQSYSSPIATKKTNILIDFRPQIW